MALRDDDSKKGGGGSIDDELILKWQSDLLKEPTGPPDRTYYKDLDFKSIKANASNLSMYYNSMERLLSVRAENETEYKEIIKMRFALYKRIEQKANALCHDWVEATANFSGSSIQRQEAYEAIIDEVKSAISGCSPPTDKDELEMLMIVLRHFGNWLLSEALNYSLGERVDSTDPQRYGLEDAKIKGSAGADAASRGQYISEQSLRKGKGIRFRKTGSPAPPSNSDSEA